VRRVLARLGFITEAATAKSASEVVTSSAGELGADDLLELFVQMKLLGQTICRFEATHCEICPLAACCRTATRNPT
jgi:endonuclease-3